LTERVRVLTDAGIDALTVHPRFFEEKFRRRARLELLGWLSSLTSVPLVANGDIRGEAQLQARAGDLRHARGIMIGRLALVQPWIFAAWDQPLTVDTAQVWQRLADYVEDDFPMVQALRRVKLFTKYYAANFAFGHSFRVSIENSQSLVEARSVAAEFFARNPLRIDEPWVAGL